MNYITDEELVDSVSIRIGGYLFAIQPKKGNNVLMEKVGTSKMHLIKAIIAFINWCRNRGTQYLTVESRNGSDIYYKIACRYFPNDSFFMDGKVLRICLNINWL